MAGLGRRTFQAGEVLTASNVMGYLQDQAVMNFAGTAARGSAIASPSEGMVSYLQDTNTVEIYDGTEWVLNTPGMVLVKSQTVGTAVSTVTVTDAFSATYDDYIITYTGGEASASNYLNLVLGATATGYYGGLVGQNYNNTASLGSDNNATKFTYFGSARADGNDVFATIRSPFLSKKTVVSANLITGTAGYTYNGGLFNSTSYTAFTFGLSGAGTITGGTIRVYGIKN